MGVLRKLAELVVEFPEDPGSAQASRGSSQEDDVLAQIERARADLDKAVKGKADNADPLSGARYQPAQMEKSAVSKQAGSQPAAAVQNPFEAGAAAGIAVPSLLSVEQIYERAGLVPQEGVIDINRVEQMLADPEMADLDLSIRARTVKLTLKAMGKELHDILLDAAQRDRALDEYGRWLGAAVEQVETQVAEANARLELEISDFISRKKAEIEANSSLLAQAHAARQSFASAKQLEEQRLFEAAAPFVAPGENPVVINADSPAQGDKP